MDAAYQKLDTMSSKVDTLAPEKHPQVNEFDHMTYEEWIKKNVKNPVSHRFL